MTQFLFGFSQKKKVPVKLFFEKKKKIKKAPPLAKRRGTAPQAWWRSPLRAGTPVY